MSLPKDPIMMCSVVNMRLRDENITLDELCYNENIEKQDLIEKLNGVGFEYDEELNKFW